MTTYVYYVNPGADAGGDGTADTLTGSTCAYQTLNAAITALAGSETGSGAGTSGDTIIYRCSGTSGNYEDSSAVDVTGHTTGVNVIIEGYNGNYTGRNLGDAYDASNCYNLSVEATALTVSGSNVTVRYLQVDNAGGSSYQKVIAVSSGATGCVIDSCRCIRSSATTGHGAHITIYESCIVKNCTTFTANINTFSHRGNAGIYVGTAATSTEIYNCSISGSIYGIATDGDVEGIFQNNAVWGSVSDWYDDDSIAFNGTGTFSYNASQDTPPYTNTANHVTMSSTLSDDWTDRTTGDLTITDGSSTLATSGTSGGNIPTVDINGVSRSNYSIGAFEYVSGGGIAVTTGSVTVTGTNASISQANNISVGTGAVAVTGTNATVAQANSVSVGTVAVTVSGTNASISQNRAVAATTGSVVVTGANVSLSADTEISVGTGAVTVTGVNASVNQVNALHVGTGAVTVTATNATVVNDTENAIAVTTGSVTVTGTNAVIDQQGQTAIAVGTGSVVVSGTAAVINQITNLQIGTGSITVTGLNAAVAQANTVSVGTGAVTVSGTNATVIAPNVLSLNAKSIVVTGFNATITGLVWTEISSASTSWTPIASASTTWTET